MWGKRWLSLLSASLLLFSCIYVDDFGEYWHKGTVDKLLVGAWDNGSDCVVLSADKDTLRFQSSEEGEAASSTRTLTLGKHTFLMFKSPGERSYMMMYTVTPDEWDIYMPNSDKKDEFLQRYATTNFSVDDNSITIHKLDKPTVTILEELAGKPEYWEKTEKPYRRVSGCKPDDQR